VVVQERLVRDLSAGKGNVGKKRRCGKAEQ
jgi:hypothetical protein